MNRKLSITAIAAIIVLMGIGLWNWSHTTQVNRTGNQIPGANANNASTVVAAPVAAVSQQTNVFTSRTAKNFDLRYPYRLSNTDKPFSELARSDKAILLRHALIDTSDPAKLNIPAHLRSQGDPGAYVVQSKVAVNDQFRAAINKAGGEIVAYIPNNAFLVKMDAASAATLAQASQTQSVQPYEPYFKPEQELLRRLLKDEPLPEKLLLVLFPGTQDKVTEQLQNDGIEILRQDKTPFGPMLAIRGNPETTKGLVQKPEVQALEMVRERVSMNDLGRVHVSVSPDPTNAAPSGNYLGLMGKNVMVSINDSGVDERHPALQGRVFYAQGVVPGDTSGHGTHVAGTIAGDGKFSETISNAPGSIAGANFRGMAPSATLFAQLLNFDPLLDTELQKSAARTNAFISNNSWVYSAAYDYTFASASFDAATRDALPEEPGSHPLLFVFAAGNEGDSDMTGQGGSPSTILAPGTGKNVITVGNVEQKRNITNYVIVTNLIDGTVRSNRFWLGQTDTSTEVAFSSSRGNVSPGQEGDFGRIKPDVVAPGQFVISCRATDWQDPTNAVGASVSRLPNLSIPSKSTNNYSIFVPDNAINLRIRIVSNPKSPRPMPVMPIFVKQGTNATAADLRGNNNVVVVIPPQTPADTWYYSIANPSDYPVNFDLEVTIGNQVSYGNYFDELKKLNDPLAPYYRYESGTSMAAPMVSGVLALMQEYYSTLGITNNPALMKALLINGARSLPDYDFNSSDSLNAQGWGMVNITNSLHNSILTQVNQTDARLTNTLKSGDSMTWNVTHKMVTTTTNTTTSGTGTNSVTVTNSITVTNYADPLRITLVWTDPPGNPTAGLKLVNDLDLIVTNLDTGEIFMGNQFEDGSDFSIPFKTTGTTIPGTNTMVTNALPKSDYVNNVENIYIKGPDEPNGDIHYSVTVVARRINVNSITTSTNFVAQDFALVVSSGNGAKSQTVVSIENRPVPFSENPWPQVTTVTNGQSLFKRRVGANAPLAISTNGIAYQWDFFVYTNSVAGTNAGTNLAFITFIPPNLSRARTIDADIDMYVSRNSTLTNLDPIAIESSVKSAKRGGNELVVFANADDGVYYIGVKSEDQQAAEFGFITIAHNGPFSDRDEDGNLIVHGMGTVMPIPDGAPDDPQAAIIFAIAVENITMRRVVVTNELTHDNLGDLIGNLSHAGSGTGDKFVVLNDHTFGDGTSTNYFRIYDDSDEGDIEDSIVTDGPGSLLDFAGEDGQGVWMLTMVDNALQHTGVIDSLTLRIEPSIEFTNDNDYSFIEFSVGARRFYTLPVRVPPGVTNMMISVAPVGDSVNLELYVRRDLRPTQNLFDKFMLITPPGGEMTYSIYDSPPLSPGLYFIGVFNPNDRRVKVRLGVKFGRNRDSTPFQSFTPGNSIDILDDATTNSSLYVPVDMMVADVMVDVRVDHPRVSDLVMHLVSPTGTRLLLAENRGGLFATNYGAGYLITNYLGAVQAADTNIAITNIISTTQTVGTLRIDYEFQWIPDDMRIYQGTRMIFQSGFISGKGTFLVDFGPSTETNLYIVMNQEGGNLGTVWEYWPTLMYGDYSYVTFTENTNWTTMPIKYQPPPFDPAAHVINTNLTNLTGLSFSNRLFVLPEESLNKLIGERARGFWKLEIWDNLAGNTNPPGQLVTWKLHLGFINTNPPVTTLTNRVAITNSISGGQSVFFVVDVPSEAQFATNTLRNISGDGTLDLIFSNLGIPGSNTPGTVTLITNLPSPQISSVVLDTVNNPGIVPGGSYYLGVRNNGAPGDTNTFSLRVDFDLMTLTPNNPPLSFIMPSNVSMVYIEINFPSDSAWGSVALSNLSGNLDLYAMKAPSFPTTNSYDFISQNAGQVDELITITNELVLPGVWYIGIYNPDPTNQVSFTIDVRSESQGTVIPTPTKTLRFQDAFGFNGSGIFTMSFDVPNQLVGAEYQLQTSSNLVEWVPLLNIILQQSGNQVSDGAPVQRQRYYRLVPVQR